MALSIKTEKIRNIPFVKIIGRIIGADSKRFNRKMESLVKKNDKKILVDISEVEFIDSYGLGAIVYYHTFMQKDGRELIFYNKLSTPQTYVARLFEFTRLNQVFRILNSLDNL